MTPENQDDELLRSYLLGKLPDEDADRLEERLLADENLFDLAEAVELDLLAAADRGGIKPAEREEILRKLAASPRGRERLALARSLNILADEKAVERTVVPFPRRAPSFPPPAIHWMALAASLTMVVGLGLFAWINRGNAPVAPVTISHRGQTPAPTPQPSPTPSPAPPSTAMVMVSLMTTRGETAPVEKLTLSPATQIAEIQIDAEGLDATKSFSMVIRRGGEKIWNQSGLRITTLKWGPALVAKVAAQSLKAGKYEVAVTPEGGSEELTHFDVVRETM